MKYLKIFENASAIGNPMVKFTSKNDKLESVKNEINGILGTLSDKQIGYNYANGSKGIYFTNSKNELVDDNGYGCTTYSELLSNLESILYMLKNLKSTNIVPLPAPPTSEPLLPELPQQEEIEQPMNQPVVAEISIKKFDTFEF